MVVMVCLSVLQVVFNNHDHDGQMLLNLDVGARVLECHGSVDLATAAWTMRVSYVILVGILGRSSFW